MDPGPARSPDPETLGAWVPPPSTSEGQGPLMEALYKAALLRASGQNPLIALLTGGVRGPHHS